MTDIAKLITKDTVCRLCFGICNDLREIYDGKSKYSEIISKFLYLQLIKNDGLSNKICWSCADFLDMIQKFYTKIINTQKHHLSTKFEQYQLEPVFIVKNFDSSDKSDEVQIPCQVQHGEIIEVVSPENDECAKIQIHTKSKKLEEKSDNAQFISKRTRSSLNNAPVKEKPTRTYNRKCKKETVLQAEKCAASDVEPDPFENDFDDSEDEYEPPPLHHKRKRKSMHDDNVQKPDQNSQSQKNPVPGSKPSEEYSIIAVDEPNLSATNETFSEEWPSAESYEKFPNKLIDNGCLLIRGKELNDLVSKFFKLQCELCKENTRFNDIRDMYQHYKQHKSPGFVRCCGTKIERYRCAVFHMARHLQPEAFKCKICNYIVTRPKFLETHLKTHLPEEEKPFVCPECPKRFCWKAAYQVHLETHKSNDERKTYMCSSCPKVYDTPGGLSTHKKLVHNKHKESDEKHVCHVCAKKFATKTGLNEHMNTIHQREKTTIQCKECGKWLMNKRCLKTHMLLHSNIDHKCPDCDYTTKKHFLLAKHNITHHSTEKPFECDKCQKKFKLKRALTVHMQQSHADTNKSYKCNFCEKTFGSSTNFYTHRKNFHPNELAELRLKTEEEKRLKRIEAGLEEEESTPNLKGDESDEMLDVNIEDDGQMVIIHFDQNKKK
uniref:CSON011366 protein n=1 Tax=Culicoides sonorensis TaxID=179676 RepID=A0A336KK47_CULSO